MPGAQSHPRPHILSLRPSSSSLYLCPSSLLSSSWAGGTAIGQDDRPGGSGLLHHVPVVSAVPEGPDVDRNRTGSAGGVRVRVRGGQAAGCDPARMGRLSGSIPGQIQLDLRGEEVFRADDLAWNWYRARSNRHALSLRKFEGRKFSNVGNVTVPRFSENPRAHKWRRIRENEILRRNGDVSARWLLLWAIYNTQFGILFIILRATQSGIAVESKISSYSVFLNINTCVSNRQVRSRTAIRVVDGALVTRLISDGDWSSVLRSSCSCITLRYTAPVECLFWRRDKMPYIGKRLLQVITDKRLDEHPIFFHVFSNGGAFLYQHISLAMQRANTQFNVRTRST